MDSYDDCSHLMEEMVCRFYVTSGCLDGDQCLFPHVDSDTRVPDTICRYFLKGKCMFGRFCRFNHVVVFRGGSEEVGTYGDVYQMTETESENEVLIANMEKYKIPVLFISEEKKTEVKENDGCEGSQCRIHYHPVISAAVVSAPTPFENLEDPRESLGFDLTFKQCVGEESCPYKNHASNFVDSNHTFEIRSPGDLRGFHLAGRGKIKCGLCSKRVSLPPSLSESCQFGQLQNCSHLFCLNCILAWNGISKYKNKSVYRNVHVLCPECGMYSRNILPSHVWMRDLAVMYT